MTAGSPGDVRAGGGDPGVPEALRAHIQSEPWARALGVRWEALAPGYCRVSLALTPEQRNYLGHPHGGVIFSLADVAFGAACNSHGATALAVSMTITFLTAVPADAVLIAEARERHQGRQTGFYDVTVRTAEGALVATLGCVSHRISGGSGRSREGPEGRAAGTEASASRPGSSIRRCASAGPDRAGPGEYET